MSDKQKQIETAWKASEGLDRVRGKLLKRSADKESPALLDEYKNEPNKNKQEKIDAAWTKYESAKNRKEAQTSASTTKQIMDYMQEQNG